MKALNFPDWREALANFQLPEQRRNSFAITIGWFLSFCRRGRGAVTVQSAREFIDGAGQQKKPQPWQLEPWKASRNWFFREAKESQAGSAGGVGADSSVWMPKDKAQWPSWKVAFLTTVRWRKYSDRTEQSSLVWIERFARHVQTADLQGLGAEQLAGFQDTLALEQRLSASSQRQALHALVFLYREVFGRELGDFSEYRRAKVRPHLPVWRTREETKRLFDKLREPYRLMAQVMYGGGLRLMSKVQGPKSGDRR
jgi:hypothetical protein